MHLKLEFRLRMKNVKKLRLIINILKAEQVRAQKPKIIFNYKLF